MLSLFLAKRFFHSSPLASTTSRNASAPAIRIATAGIAIGLAVMLITVGVVKGYQREVQHKLTGFASPIEVFDPASFSSPESYPVVTDKAIRDLVSQTPGVQRVQRVSEKMGIFKTKDDFAGMMLKGVAQDYDLSFMRSQLVEGELPEFRDDRSSNSIVISRMMAKQLGLKVGDRIYSYYFSDVVKQRRFKVAGIYETHLHQFDKTFVLTDLYTVNRLNNWLLEQSSGLEVHLHSYDELPTVQALLAQKLDHRADRYGRPYRVISIDQHPRTASVLAWLEMLDLNVMVILIIMICVSGITMISGLLILILERTSTIGVLKALGASNRRIRHTFLWFASFLILRGMLIGNVLGLGLLGLQHYAHLVKLDPAQYYVEAVPVSMNLQWLVGINLASLLLMMLAMVLPSFFVSRVEPAKTIQFD